jgi:hypothetical protein
MTAKNCPVQVTTPERGQESAADQSHRLDFDFVTGLADNVTGDAYSALMLADHLLAVTR